MKQEMINELTIDWDKVYINHPRETVIIYKDNQKKEVHRVMNLKKFKELLKKVPSINFLISIYL